MHRIALLLAVVLAACTAAPPPTADPAPLATHEAGTIAVTALLDLSGNRSPKGDAQRNAMQQWADAQRSTPRVKLRIVDVAGSDAKLLLELKRASESADTDAVVIGVPATLDEALARAVGLLARPVLFTLPVAEPVTAGENGRWMFGLAPSLDSLARVTVDALPSLATPAIVVTSGTLAAGREELAIGSVFRAQERPLPFVLSAAPTQRDVFAQRFRPFASVGSAVFFTGAASDYLSPVRLIPNDGLGGPSVILSYLTDPGDASRLGDAAAAARWPALRRVIGTSLSTHAATATDALALLAVAGDGTGDAERARAKIENGTFAGIATTYSFTPTRHGGVDQADITLVAWENGRIVAARPIGPTR
ncbi:MAG: hypothetical protein ABI888_00830 [Chloroflexota bacterium]